MALYIYQAMDSSGNPVKGTLEAKDKSTLVSRLQDMGYFPVRIGPTTNDAEITSTPLKLPGRGVSARTILAFTQELSGMLEAGLTLDRSISILVELEKNDAFKKVLLEIHRSIHSGETFADCLEKYPKIFSDVYVNTIRAGEAGGSMESVLMRLKKFMQDAQRLKEDIKSALIYPLLLTIVGGSAVSMMILFVIPRFSMILDDMGGVMPLPTQILLYISDSLRSYWPVLILLILTLLICFRYFIRTEDGRLKFDRFKLALPMLGPVLSMAVVSRFSRTLGTLMQGGLPILDALKIAVKSMGNTYMAQEIGEVVEGVRRGKGLAHSLQEARSFPALAIHMLSVGEETGRMDETLIRLADKYDRDINIAIKRFLSLLEPMIIIIMAVIVGFIVISLMLAVFSISDMPI